MRTLLLVLALIGCASPTRLDGPDAADAAEAPLLGDDGVDAADRDCQVVLRRAGRAVASDGSPAGACVDGLCWLAFDATFDVADAALDEGVVPAVLYRNPYGDGWREASAAATEGAPRGFTRFVARMAQGGIRDGLSGTAMSRVQLELVAFVRAASGARIFDHNEHPGDFDNTVLTSSTLFSFEGDAAICPGAPVDPPDATLTFAADFSETASGAVVAGGRVAVAYDPARLPECFGDVYMGRRTWDTLAHARFLPSGETAEPRSVIACDDARCAHPTGAAAVFEVPDDAEAIELWFSTSGRSCGVHWDSDFGANYRFDVLPPVDWVGGFVAKISRAGGAPCEGVDASDMGGSVGYGTWARSRAVTSHVCFRAWSEGVTDGDAAALDARVRASVACTWDGESEARAHGVRFDAQIGNDARYRMDLRAMDPFAPYRCPEVPTRIDGGYETAGATCHVVANGAAWGPGGEGSTFRVTFSDYPSNPWRDGNCP